MSAPKYRTKVFYYQKSKAISEILKNLYEHKGINISKEEVCPDYIHMLVKILPKISVSSFMEE